MSKEGIEVMKETKKPTGKKKKSVKRSSTRYYDAKTLMGWRTYDPGIEWAEKVADTLLEWSEDKKAISFNAFYDWYGIPPKSYYALVKKYDCIREVHEFVKIRFAERREQGALDRTFDAKTVAYTLHKYDAVWKEVHDEAIETRRELAEKGEKNKPTEITVVMDSFDHEEDDHEEVEMA